MAPYKDIFIALFHRNKEDSFHWIIAVPLNDTIYVKLHARNSIAGFWNYECVEQKILESASLTVLVKIGNLDVANKTIEQMDAVLKDIAMATPRSDGGRRTPFDCVIWIRVAVRALHDNGFVKCDDALALEKECQRLAEEHYSKVLQGEAKYKVYDSECCTSVA